jgi:hypothetical protein
MKDMTADEFKVEVLEHKCGQEHITASCSPKAGEILFYCGECHTSWILGVHGSRSNCLTWPDSIRGAAYSIVERCRRDTDE